MNINERYVRRKGGVWSVVQGKVEEIEGAGIDLDALPDGVSWWEKFGGVDIRGDADAMEPVVAAGRAWLQQQEKHICHMKIRDLVDTKYDAEVFFSSIAHSSVGDVVTRRTPGAIGIGVSWSALSGALMRDKWCSPGKKLVLTGHGVSEAVECLQAMQTLAEISASNRTKGRRKQHGQHHRR